MTLQNDAVPWTGLDAAAWDELVDRFGARMWAVARAFGLTAADAADAVQGAWLRLVENWDTIREPAALGAWLITTTRREAAVLSRRRRGERLIPDPPEPPDPDPGPWAQDPAAAVVSADEGRRLLQTVDRLQEPCRMLLRLLVEAPDAGYRQIAGRLGVPIGSVGPLRGRCLARLRRLLEAAP